MYSICVINFGLNPKEVLDEMELYEITPLLENYYLKEKEGWEQSRMIAYTQVQSNSTKQLAPQDIMKFSWEQEKPEEIDMNEVEKIKEEMKRISNGK